MGSACELECETILSLDLAFITESIQKQILDVLIPTKQMLSGLASSLVVQPKRPRRQKGSVKRSRAAVESRER